MKIPSFSIVSIFFFATHSVSAQYFSAGWSPGQPATQQSAEGWSPDQQAPTNPQTRPSFDWTRLFTSGPVGSLLNSAGINITKNLEVAAYKEANRWDRRIALITDDNYDDLIVNEPLTEQEEMDRVWFLVITVARGQSGGLSEIVDQRFDSAYNATVTKGDLPHVRWGRIDYLEVTALTTKWAVWQGPRVMIITDRGRTLRFFNLNQIRDAETIREWLKDEQWKQHEPWNTAYAPGGDREWIMDYFAFILSKYYAVASRVPKWVLLIGSGSIASVLIGFFHKNPPIQTQPPRAAAPPAPRALKSALKPAQPVQPAPMPPPPARVTTPKPQERPATPSKSKGGKVRKGRK